MKPLPASGSSLVITDIKELLNNSSLLISRELPVETEWQIHQNAYIVPIAPIKMPFLLKHFL